MNDALNLEKGEKVDLTKGNPGLSKITVGCGWDVNAAGGDNFDLDTTALLLKADKSLFEGNKGVIYFGNLVGHGLKHHGDNLTGAGDGDDECIDVDLAAVPADVHRIVIIVNIYQADSRKQHFGQVRNAFVRIFKTGEPAANLAKFDLSEDYSGKTGMIMGQVYRHNGEWKFEAMGNGANGDINQIKDRIVTLLP